jgi:hypothetical protein
MKFVKGQSGNPAGRPKKAPPAPPTPGYLAKILMNHPNEAPNPKFEIFGRPKVQSIAKLIWGAVTNGETRFAHGATPLTFAEWFQLVNWLFVAIDQPDASKTISPAFSLSSELREQLLALADQPCIGQTHFDNKNALANMIWFAVYDGMLGVRTGVIHLTPREWFIMWV